MGFFNLIESFFFLSLGITFVLIFLIVFYFKQRLEKLEKNNQALGDICNEIIKELSTLKSICISSIISPTPPPPQRNIYNPLPVVNPPASPYVPPSSSVLQGGNLYQGQGQVPQSSSSSNDFKKIIVLNNVVEIESEDENSETDSESSYEQEGEEEEYGLDSDIELEENIKFEVIDHGIDYEKMRILQNESHIVFSSNPVSESLLEVIEEEDSKIVEIIPEEEDLEEAKAESEAESEVFVEILERISSDGFTILSDKKPELPEDSLKHATKECLDEILDSVEIIQNDVIVEEKVASTSTVESMREECEEDMKKIPIDTRNYKKMNVEELKSLVVSKGLATDASKLKKNDLIRLLTQ